MSQILVFALSALGIVAVVFGAIQASNGNRGAQWAPLMTGILLGGALIGIAQCIRLLLAINGKL